MEGVMGCAWFGNSIPKHANREGRLALRVLSPLVASMGRRQHGS
jgi:hypothetical protein